MIFERVQTLKDLESVNCSSVKLASGDQYMGTLSFLAHLNQVQEELLHYRGLWRWYRF